MLNRSNWSRIGFRIRGLAILAALAAGMVTTRAYGVQITGGTVTNYPLGGTNFTAHIFTTVGTHKLTVMAGGNVDVLIVGGGGGGGTDMGGGGGAGGLIFSNALDLAVGEYTVIVGAGGAGAAAGSGHGPANNGGASVLSNSAANCLTALGGGGGATTHNADTGRAGSGGSGGGASGRNANHGLGTAGQGNDGASAAGEWYPGGGGGAGGAGRNRPAHGGVGIECSILDTPYYFAGGGGGSGYSDVGGSGGAGGGGGGGVGATTGGSGINIGQPGGGGAPGSQCNTPGGDAGANTGGGGGGGAHYNATNKGGAGGSGIVIVRYVAFNIRNRPVSDVTGVSATLNGQLDATGGEPASVCVLWGEQNGGSTWDWVKTDWFDGDQWSDNSPFSKKITGLGKNKTYYYTYGAKRVTTKTISVVPVPFITGEVTLKATQSEAREKGDNGVPVPAVVTVSRPAACVDAPLPVAFSVSGTASNGEDYAKLSGTVTLPAGETSVDILISPWNEMLVEGDETVSITLLPGPYIVGNARVATVTVMDTVVRSFYVSPDGTSTPPYDTWAKGFSNLQAALDHAAAKGDAEIYLAGGRPLTGPALGATHPDNTVFRWRGVNNVILRGGYRADAKLPPAGHPGPRTAGPTILRRSTADAVRVLTLSAVTNAVIEQVTIREGSPGGRRGLGGGVFLSGCRDVVFKDCRVVCNTNAHSAVGLGGGMYLVDSHVTLTDTTIATNTVVGPYSYGGGIYVHRDSRVSMSGSTIAANRAITSDGHVAKAGGYYVVPGGNLDLDETEVRENKP